MEDGSVGAASPGTSQEPGAPAGARLQRVRHKRARRAWSRPSWLTLALSAVAVLLAVAVGWLTGQVHGQSVTASQRTAVLTAARQEALDLTTL
ncbi:MAG: hypothetical protein ACRDN0_10000, partial [Trebonia sp.]